MKVLVIPEDFRNDQYFLKPLFQRLFESINPQARVKVCNDPLLGGVDQALNLDRLDEIVDRYKGMIDLFILCVDRDGEKGRRARLDEIERRFFGVTIFLAENAWEEIETWLLAGIKDLPKKWSWKEIRSEVHVKKLYFEPLAQIRGVEGGPGRGRKTLGEEAAKQITAIRQKCPEDFDNLAKRLKESA